MGESLYVIPSAEHVQAVYRAPKTLDFDPFIKEMLGKYGITTATASKMFDTLPGHGRNWMESSIENFKLQMHPGSKLDIVQNRLLGFVNNLLVWDRVIGRMVLQDGEEERLVSLYRWSEMVIVDAQTRAFFDDSLYANCPDLLAQFQVYEDESWKLPMDLPDFATKALRQCLWFLNITSAFQRNTNLTTLGLFQLYAKTCKILVSRRVSRYMCCSRFIACKFAISQEVVYPLTRLISMNANAYKLVFWIISYLLFEPKLMEELKAETAPAFLNGKHSAPDLQYLFDSCPLLVSTCEEVLRLTNWPIGTRTVQTDTVIGEKMLRQGRKLLMPYRVMHFDPTVFGADADDFNPRRFIKKKALVANKSYRPFGGAAHYCPGRYIARREVQMFTAVMLQRFDMSLAVGKSTGYARERICLYGSSLPSNLDTARCLIDCVPNPEILVITFTSTLIYELP
jgi:hypothetical protein